MQIRHLKNSIRDLKQTNKQKTALRSCIIEMAEWGAPRISVLPLKQPISWQKLTEPTFFGILESNQNFTATRGVLNEETE